MYEANASVALRASGATRRGGPALSIIGGRCLTGPDRTGIARSRPPRVGAPGQRVCARMGKMARDRLIRANTVPESSSAVWVAPNSASGPRVRPEPGAGPSNMHAIHRHQGSRMADRAAAAAGEKPKRGTKEIDLLLYPAASTRNAHFFAVKQIWAPATRRPKTAPRNRLTRFLVGR